jgi:hypothetical protein
MLPEVMEETPKQLYLWQVYETASFLELELGEKPEEKDRHYSIDPYSFMTEEHLN